MTDASLPMRTGATVGVHGSEAPSRGRGIAALSLESCASVQAAAILAEALPAMIVEAENGGLMIIAEHLAKALKLATRVAKAAQKPNESD